MAELESSRDGGGSSNDEKNRRRTSKGGKRVAQSRWLYAVDEEWRPFDDDDNARIEARWAELVKDGKLPAKKSREDDGRGTRETTDSDGHHMDDNDEADDTESSCKDEDKDKDKSLGELLSHHLDQGGKKVSEALSSGVATPQGLMEKAANSGGGNQNEESSNIVNEHLDPDAPKEEREMRVEVLEDKLFDVDLQSMKLFPVFWKGVLLPVVHAHWFYSAADGGYAPIPSDDALSRDLDRAYEVVKPWKRFKDEKRKQGRDDRSEAGSAKDKEDTDGERSEDEEAEEDSKEVKTDSDDLYELPSISDDGQVHFKSETLGHIYTKDVKGRFLNAFGGSLIVRGWDTAVRRSNQSKLASIFDSSNLPWAAGSEVPQDGDTSDASRNDRHGAKGAQRGSGAAKADSSPRKAGSYAGSSSASQEKEASQGWLGRLWPRTDSLIRPDVALLRAIGWSKDDANEEGQRKAQQKNTEEGLRKEKGSFSEDNNTGDVVKVPVSDERAEEPPELVLVVHGIGQKLVEEFDALDFVYDVERLRNISKSLAKHADVRRMSKGKRVQYLPICWRRDLSFDSEDPVDGVDNKYTLQDVSNDATIPLVRNIISKVVLDVPYYLSRHQHKMIDAVKTELNRVYRLFALRNPEFEKKGGRVNLICHSLGSSLAVDILSHQPTYVPPLDQQDEESHREGAPLCFNVRNLFFVGSPNGFFFHLHGGQLIARRGTARTKDMTEEAALDKVGQYGCLAAESIYNCYNTTDPVAFKLAPTVDCEYARMLRPVSLSEAVPALLEALALPRLSLSKIFDVVHPYSKAGDVAAMPVGTSKNKVSRELIDSVERLQQKKPEKPGNGSGSHQDHACTKSKDASEGKGKEKDEKKSSTREDATVLVEKGVAQKRHQVEEKARDIKEKGDNSSNDYDFERLVRAEKRFRALNPHGCIDFTFSSGGYNQYLEMLSAHMSYWTSKTFATFVLTQLVVDVDHERAPTLVPNLDVDKDVQDAESGDTDEEGG